MTARRTYRKFPSRYGWNYPTTPGWLGYTVALRVGIVVILLALVVKG